MKLPPKRLITHDRLRKAIQELILEMDWPAVTVQDVAQKASVSVGTFYNYYQSKDEALADIRACLTDLMRRDLGALLATQESVEKRIALLVKYFCNLINNKPSWASYFFKAERFSDRIDGGLSYWLVPLILEGRHFERMHFDSPEIAANYIENGLFPLLKRFHMEQTQVTELQSHQLSMITLASLGLHGESLEVAVQQVCPVTPLATLPVSIFELERQLLGFA